jgi:hypothetical protein
VPYFFKSNNKPNRSTLWSGAMGSSALAHARSSRHSVITEPFALPGSSASSSRAVRQACEDILELNQHECTERYGHVDALITLLGDTDADSQCSTPIRGVPTRPRRAPTRPTCQEPRPGASKSLPRTGAPPKMPSNAARQEEASNSNGDPSADLRSGTR